MFSTSESSRPPSTPIFSQTADTASSVVTPTPSANSWILKEDPTRTYYIWDKTNREEFELWWKGTLWSLRNSTRPESERIRIKWDHSGSRTTYWQYLVTAAAKTDGLPKVLCIRCNTVLNHPDFRRIGENGVPVTHRTGASHLSEHFKANRCKKASTIQGLS